MGLCLHPSLGGSGLIQRTLSKDDSFLVTGNLKHYPMSPRVITPSDFVNII